MTHLRTLIWCQPSLSSPGASDIVYLFPVLTCMAEWKGPGIVFTTGSPQVPSQQYGGRHGSQRAQRVSSSLTDLTKWYEFLRGKSNRGFGKNPYSFFGKDFRRQHRLEWEREHGLKRRSSSKLPFHYDFDLVAIRAEGEDPWSWTLWYLKMRWVVLKHTWHCHLFESCFLDFTSKIESPGGLGGLDQCSFVISVHALGEKRHNAKGPHACVVRQFRIRLPLEYKLQRGSIAHLIQKQFPMNCYHSAHRKFSRTHQIT